MKRHLKIISLLVLTALISLTLILGGDFTLSFTNQEHNARQPKVVRILDNVSNQLIEVPLTPEIKTKNARLKELSKDVVKILPKLDPSGFFFAGMQMSLQVHCM
ncbi:MAG: hypothetical protein DDT40_01895 [candidate division WS2 bacterium]|nr:hypothetical protein [Candidatus Psychracetigena formicireducens]